MHCLDSKRYDKVRGKCATLRICLQNGLLTNSYNNLINSKNKQFYPIKADKSN